MNKLNQLKNKCKCSVSLTINNHKDYYQSAQEYINELQDKQEIDQETIEKMIELDTIIELRFYPNTPVGFYSIYHYDLDTIINQALDILDE